MRKVIDRCARELVAHFPAFTRRNLLYAVRRSLGGKLTDADFDRALAARLTTGALEGLLPERCDWRLRRLTREWDAYFPAAIVLVDRASVLDLFIASGAIASGRLAVVSLEGDPPAIVAWLKRGFRAKRRAPVVYLHDARTVVHSFAFEPLATLAKFSDEPIAYRDLGLPPLGLNAQDFPNAELPHDETIFALEALPAAALVAHAAREALRLVPGDPNMLPLARGYARQRREEEKP